MNEIILLTTLLVFISAIFVLWNGDWQPFKLKYIGVAIAGLASAGIFIKIISLNHGENPDYIWQLLGMARNIAFILLIIAAGRDCIQYKNHDRRSGCSTKK